MEKQIISMKEKENIMANIQQLLEEYDYEYTEDAINKIINRWAEQKADLINLLSKHPNYVDGQFLIAFNTDWNREINGDGAFGFAKWILDNIDAVRENLPECIKQKRNEEFAQAQMHEVTFNHYYPITSDTRFLIQCPRRICVSIPKRRSCKYS